MQHDPNEIAAQAQGQRIAAHLQRRRLRVQAERLLQAAD
jgi:hypothetical protein